jgi:phage terminase large subunit-like protein
VAAAQIANAPEGKKAMETLKEFYNIHREFTAKFSYGKETVRMESFTHRSPSGSKYVDSPRCIKVA